MNIEIWLSKNSVLFGDQWRHPSATDVAFVAIWVYKSFRKRTFDRIHQTNWQWFSQIKNKIFVWKKKFLSLNINEWKAKDFLSVWKIWSSVKREVTHCLNISIWMAAIVLLISPDMSNAQLINLFNNVVISDDTNVSKDAFVEFRFQFHRWFQYLWRSSSNCPFVKWIHSGLSTIFSISITSIDINFSTPESLGVRECRYRNTNIHYWLSDYSFR